MTVSSIPASVLVTWPTPNYIDPVTRDWLPAFILVWQIASTVLLTGRFWLRARRQAGPFGWDDLLIFLGWVCPPPQSRQIPQDTDGAQLFSIALSASAWVDATSFGIDRHTWDVKLEWGVGAALTGWIGQVFFVLSTVCTKISVLLFYRRMIKDRIDRRWLWALRGALTFTSCYGIALTVAYFCYCQPVEAIWLAFDPTYDKSYRCFDGQSLVIVAGVASVISDFMAVSIPCLMLRHYNLNASRRQKVALNATFGAGLLVTGCGIARSYYLWKVQHTYDSTWTGFELFAWSIVECQLAIICACAPSLRVFFRRYLAVTIKRMTSSVSHYAQGSREPTRNSMMISSIKTERHSRGFHELKELESGVHGVAYPPPVIVRDSREIEPISIGSVQVQRPERIQTPKITSAEQYTGWAIERTRLSRQSSLMLRPDNTGSTLDGLDDIMIDEKAVRRRDSEDVAK